MPERGDMYQGTFAESEQIVLVISADRRNRLLPSVIVAPVLSMDLDFEESAVHLGDAEPATGTILLDFPFVVGSDEIQGGRPLGKVSHATLDRIDEALLYVFGLM